MMHYTCIRQTAGDGVGLGTADVGDTAEAGPGLVCGLVHSDGWDLQVFTTKTPPTD